MLVKIMSRHITARTPKITSVSFTLENNCICLGAGISLSLCSLLHISFSLRSSGFGSQQAIFSLAGGFLCGSDKHLPTHISEILPKEEKPHTLSSQSLFLYTGMLRAMVVDRDYKHSLTFKNKYL